MLIPSGKLPLNRDFTRFLNDPSFPYKVTVCIDDKRIFCSGVLLAQQSSILEQKFREDNGVLMFDEMLQVENSNDVLHECVNFLHGADVTFTLSNIEVILKFASWYNVQGLMEEALSWILCFYEYDSLLRTEADVTKLLNLLIISNCLDKNASTRLKSIVFSILDSFGGMFYYDPKNRSLFDLLSCLSCNDVAEISCREPFKFSTFFKDWLAFSSDNKKFVLENVGLFDMEQLFPTENDFSDFVALISSDSELMNTNYMKILLKVQKDFLVKKADPKNKEILVESDRVGTPASRYNAGASGAPSKISTAKPCSLPSSVSNTANITVLPNTAALPKTAVPHTAVPHTAESKTAVPKNAYSLPSSCSNVYHQTAEPSYNAGATGGPSLAPTRDRYWRIDDDDWGNELCSDCSDTQSTSFNDSYEYVAEYDSYKERSVWIGNLPKSVDNVDLISLFGRFGTIEDIQIRKTSYRYDYAFITYCSIGSTYALLLHNIETEGFILEGTILKVAERR